MDKEVVVACVTRGLVEDFLGPALRVRDWPIELEFHEPTEGLEGIVAAINGRKARVLMTAWGAPKMPGDLKARVPSLQYICHLCGEVRQWLPREVLESGVLLTNWGAAISRSVAECTLLQILACLRQSTHWVLEMHVRKGWATGRERQQGLFEKKVGIHGFGQVARQLVRLLKPFDCQVSAYSKGVPRELMEEHGVKQAGSLEELFAENEVLVELEARTPANNGSVNERVLSLIRPGGVFVNTGRGALVDEAGLARVAKKGEINIAIDVYEVEPLPADSPLRGLENVFLTPHTGGPTPDRRRDAGWMALRNIERFMRGEKMEAVVDVAQYDRMT